MTGADDIVIPEAIVQEALSSENSSSESCCESSEKRLLTLKRPSPLSMEGSECESDFAASIADSDHSLPSPTRQSCTPDPPVVTAAAYPRDGVLKSLRPSDAPSKEDSTALHPQTMVQKRGLLASSSSAWKKFKAWFA